MNIMPLVRAIAARRDGLFFAFFDQEEDVACK